VTVAEAERLAGQLDLDLDDMSICLACLSTVSFAVYEGNASKVRGAVQSITPWLWEEGLEVPARMALERARRRGVTGAGEALNDVRKHGFRTRIVRAIVHRLGVELARRAKGDLTKMGFEPWPPRG
jgi:hypothetical protein